MSVLSWSLARRKLRNFCCGQRLMAAALHVPIVAWRGVRTYFLSPCPFSLVSVRFQTFCSKTLSSASFNNQIAGKALRCLELIVEHTEFTVHKMPEGARADAVLETMHKYVPLQLKCSNLSNGAFNFTFRASYDDMLVLCVSIEAQDRFTYNVFDGSSIPCPYHITKRPNSRKYPPLSGAAALEEIRLWAITNGHSKLTTCLDGFAQPVSASVRLGMRHEKLLQCLLQDSGFEVEEANRYEEGLPFDMLCKSPLGSAMRIQCKTATFMRRGYGQRTNMTRYRGGGRKGPYHKDAFDVLVVFCRSYENFAQWTSAPCNWVAFIWAADLHKAGYMSCEKQPGKMAVYLYPPCTPERSSGKSRTCAYPVSWVSMLDDPMAKQQKVRDFVYRCSLAVPC